MFAPLSNHRLANALGLSLIAHALLLAPAWHGPALFNASAHAGPTTIEVTLAATPAMQFLTRRAIAPQPAVTADDSQLPATDNTAEATAADSEARADVAGLHNPTPPYPLAARQRGLEGRVRLLARVAADGSCAEVRLSQSSGHALLDDSALATVRRWRFVPARRAGTAVEAWVEVPVSFRLQLARASINR